MSSFASTTSSYVGSRSCPFAFSAFCAISIIELFWSRASIVSVPFGLLIRCSPRSLPGVKPLPRSTVAPSGRVISAVAMLRFSVSPMRGVEAAGSAGRGRRGGRGPRPGGSTGPAQVGRTGRRPTRPSPDCSDLDPICLPPAHPARNRCRRASGFADTGGVGRKTGTGQGRPGGVERPAASREGRTADPGARDRPSFRLFDTGVLRAPCGGGPAPPVVSVSLSVRTSRPAAVPDGPRAARPAITGRRPPRFPRPQQSLSKKPRPGFRDSAILAPVRPGSAAPTPISKCEPSSSFWSQKKSWFGGVVTVVLVCGIVLSVTSHLRRTLPLSSSESSRSASAS